MAPELGLVPRKTMIRSLEFSAPISYSSEKEEGLEMELMSDCGVWCG